MDDLETSRSVALKPIAEIAARLGLGADDIAPYGRHKAKLEPHTLGPSRGKLVLVTAISPTPAGEGKTTTTIGLADALNVAGANAVACLREPSLGPCFGIKGGATGGGRAQVAPMEDINLHFTGDFHAITSAHNLLSALIDNHLYWGSEPTLDPGRIAWRRVLDMNDRALRNVVVGLGGRTNGVAREAGFDITAASEVMAILCLAEDANDLKARLARVVVGARRDGTPVHASELDAPGAMAALLIDAVRPNLVQTLEGTPAIVHGGPFANIAHGCNSVIATRTALGLADWVVTEAGFGADLGAEKFLNIKCRLTGLAPSAAVVVATIRALKMHGGVARGDLGREDVAAVIRGAANLRRHVDNVQGFGVPVVVALNRFTQDTEAELGAVADTVASLGVTVVPCDHWARGGVGALPLAEEVMRLAVGPVPLALTYSDAVPLADKIEAIARRIYRARDVAFAPRVRKTLTEWEAQGFGGLPVCMAKTQYSFSADPTALGAPDDFVLPVREVRLSAGAGFIVAITGELMTMPGLPRRAAAAAIDVVDGRISGLS